MKKFTTATVIALSAIMASPVVMACEAHANGQTSSHATSNAGKTVNVKFAKGAASANYSGQIKGTKYDTYTFTAKKGQKLKVKATGGNVDTYLFGANIADSVNVGQYSPELDKNGAYTLPATGTYQLRVLQPRSQANQGKQPKYNLQIAIR